MPHTVTISILSQEQVIKIASYMAAQATGEANVPAEVWNELIELLSKSLHKI